MANRTFTLRDASNTLSVDLTNDLTSVATGMNPLQGQMGRYRISGDNVISRNLRVFVKGSSHDNLATQIQMLTKLLDKAAYFQEWLWQTEPVYLVEQIDDETGARYATVYGSSEQDIPDFFDNAFTFQDYIADYGVALILEHPWRSGAPGVIGSAITLGESDGPAIPTKVHVANFRDDVALTHFKEYDGGVWRDLTPGDTLFPAVVAQNDAILWGSDDQPLKHIVIPKLATAGVLTTSTLTLSAGIVGPAWTELVLGTDYTCYPGPTLKNCLEQTDEDIVLSINPIATHDNFDRDGDDCFWILLMEEHVAPVYATNPVQHATEAVYAQSHPYVEIPAVSLKGDTSPLLLTRIHHPAGGDENLGFANTSRILIGAKSRGLTKFVPNLNAGGDDNPGEWATAQGTDATATAMPKAPAGKYSAVSFGSDTTLVSRVQFTGTAILDSWVGEYRAYVRCEQVGGTTKDLSIKLRTFLGGVLAYSPHIDTPPVDLAGVDEGPEVVDMGLIRLPFGRTFYNDSLTLLDVIFQIHAARSTGSATLKIYDLILFPVGEGAVGADDPVNDLDNGASALRGGTVLDIDAGVISWRVMKYNLNSSGVLIPSDEWVMMDRPISLKNLGTKTRLYFMLLHYPTTWGSGPLIAEFGASISVEIFSHYRYTVLRGSD